MVIAGEYSCALLSDASIMCWGRNSFGQLGLGDTTDRNTPTAVSGLSNVVQLTLGGALTTLRLRALEHLCVCVLNCFVRAQNTSLRCVCGRVSLLCAAERRFHLFLGP